MRIDQLPQLIKELAVSHEGKNLLIQPERMAKDEHFRELFCAKLNIPTFDKMTKAMFYDTLQQLCDIQNLVTYHDKAEESKKKEKEVGAELAVLSKFAD